MFKYKVKVYIDFAFDPTKTKVAHGLLGGAESYKEAVAILTDHYGENNIISLSIYSFIDNCCLVEYKEGIKSLQDSFVKF
ncbi:MAG: hypothetical protein E7270_01780 [Lachnospiraceae bacterium]|nr:hypothetical protein [Lachnospiraceae bacterium]